MGKLKKYQGDKELLKTQILEYAHDCIGENFQFRENQLETILKVIHNILSGEFRDNIIEAPTGSGKSIINIICAGVMAKYWGRSSYICCSDLYLFNQYDSFIKSHPDLGIWSIKGQYGNYTCDLNGEDIREGECRVAKIPWRWLIEGDERLEGQFQCAQKCKYCIDRQKLKECKVFVTTYQNLLYNYTFVKENEKQEPWLFPYHMHPRHIVFCDEAHNLPQIIQEHFTPILRRSDWDLFYDIIDSCPYTIDEMSSCQVSAHGPAGIPLQGTLEEFKETFDKCFSNIEMKSIKHYELMSVLGAFRDKVLQIVSFYADGASKVIAYKKGQNIFYKLTPIEKYIHKLSTQFLNYMCLFNDLTGAIQATDPKYLLKKYGSDEKGDYISLHCLREDFMTREYFLNYHHVGRVYTSATIGNIRNFKENLGINEIASRKDFIRVPSNFDFSKSPINIIGNVKVSYSNREQALHYHIYWIEQILKSKFPDKKGIIQTGSYANAKFIYDNASPEMKSRLILYNSARDKDTKIEIYKKSKNKIILGPTLTQGIDLPGDLIRFIIISKVPFANLGDELVQKKMKIFPKWYESQASTEIIQGIGRGVRSKNDYCETFILDSNFNFLYLNTHTQYPKEIKERFKRFKTLSSYLTAV